MIKLESFKNQGIDKIFMDIIEDIEVRIKTNQAGDFNVTGRVIYYFGDDKSTKEDYSVSLPIIVRIPPAPTEAPPKITQAKSRMPGISAKNFN